MVEPREKLQYCLAIYSILLFIILYIVFSYQTENDYFRWGVPSESEPPLIVISVVIDDYYKYCGLLGFITIVRATKVLVTEVAEPILAFTIYNPDKKEIRDFTKNELQFYGNSLYLIDSLRYVFTIMITITQIDIAIYDALVGEFTTMLTIRMLLNEKVFITAESRMVLDINDGL